MRAARIVGATLLAAALIPAAATAQQQGLGASQSYGQSGDAKSTQRKKRVEEPPRPRDQSEQSRRQQEEVDRWREMMR
jgi:hypothetical protein